MIGQTGGISLNALTWAPISTDTVFPIVNGVNIIESGIPQQFVRITGRQTITVTDLGTNLSSNNSFPIYYKFSIDVQGGITANSGGYIGSFSDQSANYYYVRNSAKCTSYEPLTCVGINISVSTIEDNPLIPINQLWITTPDYNGSGTMFYVITFSRFVGVKPTIQKSGVNPLQSSVVVSVSNLRVDSIV